MGASIQAVSVNARRVERPLRINLTPPDLGDRPLTHAVTLVVDQPLQLAAEPQLAWWHIEVRGHAEMGPIPSRVFMRLEMPDGRAISELRLMWPTTSGPLAEMMLRPGDPEWHIPVAARCIVDAQLSGAPGRLPHFALPAGIVRVTDMCAMTGHGGVTELAPPLARFRLIVRTGADEVVSPVYVFSIPEPTAPNSQFRLVQLLDEPGGPR
jgi:hypothetical protein